MTIPSNFKGLLLPADEDQMLGICANSVEASGTGVTHRTLQSHESGQLDRCESQIMERLEKFQSTARLPLPKYLPQPSSPRTKPQEGPLQLDRTHTSPEERRSCRVEGACFYCGRSCRQLKNCPVRRRRSLVQLGALKGITPGPMPAALCLTNPRTTDSPGAGSD